jgi:hypothetical protein
MISSIHPSIHPKTPPKKKRHKTHKVSNVSILFVSIIGEKKKGIIGENTTEIG